MKAATRYETAVSRAVMFFIISLRMEVDEVATVTGLSVYMINVILEKADGEEMQQFQKVASQAMTMRLHRIEAEKEEAEKNKPVIILPN